MVNVNFNKKKSEFYRKFTLLSIFAYRIKYWESNNFKMKHTPISRREFLKNIGMTGAGVLLAASPWLSAFSEAVNTSNEKCRLGDDALLCPWPRSFLHGYSSRRFLYACNCSNSLSIHASECSRMQLSLIEIIYSCTDSYPLSFHALLRANASMPLR